MVYIETLLQMDILQYYRVKKYAKNEYGFALQAKQCRMTSTDMTRIK